MNLFRKSPAAIERKDEWIGREKAWNELESCILTRQNTVIMGVEGSGKSSLLKSFFSRAYRKDRVRNHNELIFFVDLSELAPGDELADYLTNRLFFEVKRQLRNTEDYEDIIQALKEIKESPDLVAKARFEKSVQGLREQGGYYVFLIFDGFERFTSSLSVTLDHHNMLRALIEAELMTCIVATNFDLNKDSLPPDVSDSLYLQKFQNKIILPPFTLEEASEFVAKKLTGDTIQFSPGQIDYLHKLTGGIPSVFELAASYAYENIRQNAGELKIKGFKKTIYEAARPTMSRWCKLLSESHMLALHVLTRKCHEEYDRAREDMIAYYYAAENAEIKAAVTRLIERGIIVQTIEVDAYGRSNEKQGYNQFNSRLLQMFAMEGEMEAVAAENPLLKVRIERRERKREEQERKLEEQRHTQRMHELEEQAMSARAERAGAGEQSTVVNHFHGTVHMQKTVVNAGIPIKELLQMLNQAGDSQQSFANMLYEQMQKLVPQGGLSGVIRVAGMTDEEYDGQYDEAFSRQISDHVISEVAIDEDGELTEITQQEHITLETRFHEARGKRPELTDSLLDRLSERCAFYLKLSVVVEQALDFLRVLHQKDIDCSPQLVLYGKALEQHLRDCLYSLFHRESTIKNYMIPLNGQRVAFGIAKEQQTCIGNYAYCIRQHVPYLSGLCSAKTMRWHNGAQSNSAWGMFWSTLEAAIQNARLIRNKADHASPVSPTFEDIDAICELCFSEDAGNNIFHKLLVGRDLNIACHSTGGMDIAEGRKMEGKEVVFRCVQKKTNGGLTGEIVGTDCIVKISKSQVGKFQNENPSDEFRPVGKKYRVKLLEYKEQDNVAFFSAQIIAACDDAA